MTRIGVSTFLVTALMTGMLAAPRNVSAVSTVARAAASTCHFGGVVFVDTESTPSSDGTPNITSGDATAGAGRFRSASPNGGIDLGVWGVCPVVDMPGVADITNTSVADRVSVLISQPASATGGNEGRAQLCSEDNSGSTMGGSCGPFQSAASGSGVRAIDIVMGASTNWQLNASSLHYIYVWVPGGTSGSNHSWFSGYTIWHS